MPNNADALAPTQRCRKGPREFKQIRGENKKSPPPWQQKVWRPDKLPLRQRTESRMKRFAEKQTGSQRVLRGGR